MTDKLALKKEILFRCISLVEKRIEAAIHAMHQAQEAANSEGKSSAGDKYETSRAMGQLDRDMNAKQVAEAQRDLAFLNGLLPVMQMDTARPGALEIGRAHV